MDIVKAGDALNSIILQAQAILAAYLPPDGISKHEAINYLLDILDGPEQRAAQAEWKRFTGKSVE